MASDFALWNIIGNALWDPHPTKTDLQSRQLAVALGYPPEWRVVRTLQPLDRIPAAEGVGGGNHEQGETSTGPVLVIQDRIYSGKPSTGCDMWVDHAAAQKVAAQWMADTEAHESFEGTGRKPPLPTPFDHKGGHLLPRQAAYSVGDKVQVMYEDEWWEARILRVKEHPVGFRYQVYYPSDGSKQTGVEEEKIRPTVTKDPHILAASIGLDESWQAITDGHGKWKIISPAGTVYPSKRAALEDFAKGTKKSSSQSDQIQPEDDPPWRTTGHEYLGRQIKWSIEHKVTSRRVISVDQFGVVEGWISERDVDSAGNPGFLSEKTGSPAALFHVVFYDDPNMHAYGSIFVESVDLEEYELVERLVAPQDEVTIRHHKKPRKYGKK